MADAGEVPPYVARARADGRDEPRGVGDEVMADDVEVSLHDVAHGRAGDKGNRASISLIPYRPELYPLLAAQVTAARVLALFAHRGATRCVRHDLPRLHAFNFVIDDVLEGGVNGSLNLDGHGKTQSFRLLELMVRVPRHLLDPAPPMEDHA